MKQFSLLIALSLFCYAVNGQNQIVDPVTFNYSKVDSIALKFPKKKFKSYTEIVAPLTDSLKTDHEKARVIFRWITENIKYSFGNKSTDADKVVKDEKAVCIGYSTLFKEMCNSAGIECEIIEGYTKTTINDIDKKLKKVDHAWNAVKLYGKWYLVDVTWATSYFDEKKRKMVKDYDELYYLTPPGIFVKKHFPKDKKWQLLDSPMTKSEFVKPFVYYEGFFKDSITALQPNNGAIHMKLKDTLIVKFFTKIEPAEVIIELGNNQFAYSP
ncbi:MAG TPA: transglutaminase domain-containing protein, partial [Bacteroidia bacterium]|nr:transglutaminase domain-containing protein [Bacteroidia bacterium]